MEWQMRAFILLIHILLFTSIQVIVVAVEDAFSSSGMPSPPPLLNEVKPVVETLHGKVEGFQTPLDLLPPSDHPKDSELFAEYRSADIFLGVPYARPPIDELRLEKPQAMGNWSDVLEANSMPASCVPIHPLASFDYSEDCLFLNVFRPSRQEKGDSKSSNNTKRSKSELQPVLVFIHGGGFNVGGNFVEGYHNLSNNFVSQGIVVVTIQYRLGIFGFFSDGSDDLPGNLGLWDQTQALAWIQQNIEAFGGDPRRVTLWGQSAGSASVSMLTLSRHSRDLFQQALQQSGSWLSPWAINNRVVDTSLASAKQLNCTSTDSKELKACMKRVSLEDLVSGIADNDMVRGEFEIVIYNPRLDGDFFSADLEQLTKEAPRKPSMIGFNTDEAMFLTTTYPDSVFAFQSPLTVDDNEAFGEKDLISRIRDKIQPRAGKRRTKAPRNIDDFKEQVVCFYVDPKASSSSNCNSPALSIKGDNSSITKEYPYYLSQYTKLLSDVLFVVPALWEARSKAAQGWPVYLYQFDHINMEMLKKSPFRGIIHGGEYPFTVGVHIFGNYELDQEDMRVREIMLTAIAHFVKHGNPSSKKLKWPLYEPSTNNTMNIVEIVLKPFVAEPKGVVEDLHFWDSLAAEHNFNHIQGLPSLKSQ